MSDSLIPVVACPNPFKVDQVDLAVPAGLSLDAIMRRVQPDPVLARYAHVFIEDRYVAPELWARTVPQPGRQVFIRVVPSGGDGKNPLAVVLQIAVIAAAAWAGPAAAQGLGLAGVEAGTGAMAYTTAGKFVAAGVSAAVGIAGGLAVNAIAPPPRQSLWLGDSGPASRTLSIAGARNQATPYQRIPQILGRHLVVPGYAGPPYTELVGQDQYLRLLFLIGYGPLQLSDHKIGETSLFDYSDVEIEVRQGYPDDEPITLYPNTVSETAVGSTLSEAAGWIQQTTLPDVDEIAVEILFPAGLVEFQSDGDREQRTVDFEIEYAPAGSGSWTQARPQITTGVKVHTAGRAPGHEAGGDQGDAYDLERASLLYIHGITGRFGLATNETGRYSFSAPGPPAVPGAPNNCYPICSYRQTGTDRAIHSLTDLRPAALTDGAAGNYATTINAVDDYKIDIAAGFFDAIDNVASVTAKTTSAVRYGVPIVVDRGQYDVRVRRITPDSDSDQVFDEATWSVLRNIDYTDPIALDGAAAVALRIKATDQLSGIIDQYNCIAASILLDWIGTGWVEQVTSNNAALYRHVFQGPAMKKPQPDSRLDLLELQEWAEECDAKGYRYNAVIDYETTPHELARNIAAVGRAAYAMKDSQYSVVRDSQAMIDRGYRQWLTPRNSWDVQGEKSFDDIHGLRVRYVNAALGYRQDQITVYRDGYDAGSATRIDDMQLPGITDYDQAWSQGRYYLAVALLRPEMHSRMVDVEHLVCTRGDLIRVVDDVAMHGLASGRIKNLTLDGSNNVTAIELDETLAMAAGTTYGVRIRYAEVGDLYRAVDTVEGESPVVTFSVPVGPADAPELGDLVLFGETEQEGADKIVHHIQMSGDLTARVFYVDAAPGVHTADSGPIPEYEPGISVPATLDQTRPNIPLVTDVRSNLSAALRRPDGTYQDRIMISLIPGGGAVPTSDYECRYRLSGVDQPWEVLPFVPATAGVIYIPDVDKDAEYEIRVRAVSRYGQTSAWYDITHTVIGTTPVVALSNMFLNGFGEFGNALGFSQFAFDASDGYSGAGCFATADTAIGSDNQYAPAVSVNRWYELSCAVKALQSGSDLYLGFDCLDADRKNITAAECWRDDAKDSALAGAVLAGHTTVQIEPAGESWYDPSASPYSYLQVAPSNGNALPAETIRIASIDDSLWPWSIDLVSPVQNDYPAGTAVGNSTSGGAYNYVLASNDPAPTDWTVYSARIGGGVNAYNRRPNKTQFRRGTKYIRFLALPNRTVPGTTLFDDVVLLGGPSFVSGPQVESGAITTRYSAVLDTTTELQQGVGNDDIAEITVFGEIENETELLITASAQVWFDGPLTTPIKVYLVVDGGFYLPSGAVANISNADHGIMLGPAGTPTTLRVAFHAKAFSSEFLNPTIKATLVSYVTDNSYVEAGARLDVLAINRSG